MFHYRLHPNDVFILTDDQALAPMYMPRKLLCTSGLANTSFLLYTFESNNLNSIISEKKGHIHVCIHTCNIIA